MHTQKSKGTHIFALFAVVVLIAAVLQPAIANPAQNINSTNSEPSYVTPATASALTSLAQMRDAANHHGSGIDVEELIDATPGPPIAFITKWGSEGQPAGKFKEPWDVAVDSEGNVYVADTKNRCVQKYHSNGTFIIRWLIKRESNITEGAEILLPYGIAVSPDDFVYVTAKDDHCVLKFDRNGTFITEWGSEGAADGQFKNPTGIAVDIVGTVFVADTGNNRIQKFNSSGGFITNWGTEGAADGQFDLPQGIAVDSSGNVYVADTDNHRIQKFNASGKFITQWGSEGAAEAQFDLPHVIAVDSSGNVYVADTGNNRIQKFDYNGTFMLDWGSEGTGDGQFKSPAGIAVAADGIVYVADTDNNRIQKFSQRDNDGDGLPNSVELVISTDPNNRDSDFDSLNDSYEVRNVSIGTDPLKADSNGDGLGDYFEVTMTNVSLDVDGDGIPNAWDSDNDGDGVLDGLDSSPFSKSSINDKFHFDIKTNGNATYIDFQVRPKNPEHLKLPLQSWDWPRDYKGQIKDLDNSKDDVQIQPMLELNASQVPAQSQVNDYGIVVTEGYYKIVNKYNGKCVNVDIGPSGFENNICQWEYAGLDWQKWRLEPVGDGWYKIVNKHNGKCVNVDIATGDNICQWEYDGLDWQKWRLEPVGDGWYKIINKHNGKCVNVDIATGDNICQWEYDGLDWQKWRLELVEYPKAYIPLTPVQDYGTTVAFNGRMFYPASAPLNLSADAKLVWMVNDKVDMGGFSWSSTVKSPEIGSSNAGGGAAIADINGNGKPDLLLMGIDDPEGANKFWYMIGWDIDTDSNPSSWSSVIKSSEGKDIGGADDGGGAAIADINGNDKPDLLLMCVVNDEGANHFRYLIGWDIDTDGTPSSWSSVIKSPEGKDIGWADDGGGAAIADINGNDKPDLLLMCVVGDEGANHFRYLIGWDIDTDGTPSSWSSVKKSSAIGNKNAGGGAAIADINGNGKLDLLLMGIDDPKGANKFWYMVGWDIDTNGNPSSWSSTIHSPEIGSSNEGGGAAIADINGDGKLDLLLMGIDDPKGSNKFWYKIGWDIESEPTTIARYKEDFMLTGFSVEENSGADAGLFYSGDRNQTMNAYLVLKYEFLRSQNSLLEAPAKLAEHNVSVTSNISSYSHHDAALIAVLNKTKDALKSLPDGKILPIVFALSDVSANSAMGPSYIQGNEYNVDLTNKSMVTTKSIKMSWYNTTTDEIIGFDELIGDVKIWEGNDIEKKVNMLMLLLIASFGENTLPEVDGHEIEFEDPEENEVLEWMHKGYSGFEHLAGPILVIIAKRLEKKIIERVQEDILENFLDVDEGTEAWAELEDTFDAVNEVENIEQLKAVVGEEAVLEEAGLASKLGKVAEVIEVVGWIIIAVVAIYTFIAIAKAEGWSGFGFALGAVYAVMQLIFVGILVAIGCIPVVGWAIVLLIVLADIIASIFGYGSGWLMEKIIDWLVKFKIRVNLELEPGETTLNIEDYDDNGLTVGDKIEINSWFWAKASETKRGREHGDHDDYKDSYIHPKYEYHNDDSTFESSSYKHYCDLGGWTKIDHDLNAGAGGNYIYLCVKPPVQGNLKVISGDHSGISCGSGWTKINHDLNDGAGGDYIYLCVKEPVQGNLKVISGDHSGISCGSGWTKINHDLNAGAGGDYIYLCVKEPVQGNLKVFSSFSEKKCYTGLWLMPTKSMKNLPLTSWVSAGYKFYYDECIFGICSGKSNTSTSKTDPDTTYFDVLPGNINNFVNWYAISLQDTDGDGLLDSVEGHQDTYYKICAEHSGKCLDVKDASTASSANVEQWEYEGKDNQKWSLEEVGDGYYKICAKHSGKCLSIEDGGAYNGANVVQKTYGGYTDQNWRLDHVGGEGYYKIINNRSSKCLNVSDNSTLNGANVWQWTWLNKENQKWILEPVECDTNANKWDTDSDGLSDMFEVHTFGYDISPTNADTDSDGLTDMLELELGTDPTEKDTDSDGLTDFEEHRGWNITFNYLADSNKKFSETVWSNPLVNDTDFDGLTDFEEYIMLLNPRSEDTNGDGISDIDAGGTPSSWSSVIKSPDGKDIGLADDGGGAAIAYINGSDKPDLLLMCVADDKGANHFRYLIGWDIDTDGNTTSWSSVIASPDGKDVGWADDGGGAAIADINGNGNQDLLLMCVVDDKGANHFRYLIGWDIDTDGNPSSWSSVIASPDGKDVGWADDGGGAAIADINGNGNQDLLLMCVVDDKGANHFRYLIGWDIDTDGNPGSWSSVKKSSAISNKTAGGGAAIADINSNGKPDLLLMAIDDPEGANKFWYMIGWDIDTDGNPSSWSSTIPSPAIGNDTDGGGAAIVDINGNGKSDLLLMAIDAPAGANQFGYMIGWDLKTGESETTSSGGILAGASQKAESATQDIDNDGLTDETENTGWDITFTNSTGTYTHHVTSEPLLKDTDFDGLTDHEEFNARSNPRNVDTDGDGLSDYVERELGTDITHYDIDGDGLDDGTEITCGCDPKQSDTDGDGLSDFEEFVLGSDPNNSDTDSDGLSDTHEKQFNSSLCNPDSDEDLLFDAQEYNLSTDPWNPDSDSDNLTDGYEIIFYNTSALNNDTDADGILDGYEIELWTDPLCNDTDGDDISDLKELELGTDPLWNDTDGDGVTDLEDTDSYVPHVARVILAYDSDADTYEFVDKLTQYTNVTIVSPDELKLNYSEAPYIVLLGRPDGNGTVGNITRDILKISGDNATLTAMLESDYDRFAVEYGVWTPTQTVVMLTQPYHSDHYRVLCTLKGRKVTRLPDSVETEYPSTREFFSIEAIKEIGSSVWVELEEAATPWVKKSRHNVSTTPFALSHTVGLASEEEAVRRYLDITVSENVQNETRDIINWAWVGMYYTVSDLDRTGDGDADDAGDLNESTLSLYLFDKSVWTKLSEGTGVDTTNVVLYGKEYEGYVWANVSYLGLYGLAGKTRSKPIAPTPTPAVRGGGGGGGGSGPHDTDGDGISDLDEMILGTDPKDLCDSNPDCVACLAIRTPTVTPAATPSSVPVVTSAPELTPVGAPEGTPEATQKPRIPGFVVVLLLIAFAVVMGYLWRVKRQEL